MADVDELISGLALRGWGMNLTDSIKVVDLGEKAIEPLIAALKDSDRVVRANAAKAFRFLSDCLKTGILVDSDFEQAIEPLIKSLDDTDSWVRASVAWTLGSLGDERAVEPLLAVLNDSSEDVRLAASEALGWLGDERAVQPLINLFEREMEWEVRIGLRHGAGIAGALGQLMDIRAVEPLIAALRDDNELVRIGAAAALGRIGDGRAVRPLVVALKVFDEKVSPIVMALHNLGHDRDGEPSPAATNDE